MRVRCVTARSIASSRLSSSAHLLSGPDSSQQARQRALAQEQYDRHRDLESGKRKLVGVNHGAVSGEKRSIEVFELDADADPQLADDH